MISAVGVLGDDLVSIELPDGTYTRLFGQDQVRESAGGYTLANGGAGGGGGGGGGQYGRYGGAGGGGGGGGSYVQDASSDEVVYKSRPGANGASGPLGAHSDGAYGNGGGSTNYDTTDVLAGAGGWGGHGGTYKRNGGKYSLGRLALAIVKEYVNKQNSNVDTILKYLHFYYLLNQKYYL